MILHAGKAHHFQLLFHQLCLLEHPLPRCSSFLYFFLFLSSPIFLPTFSFVLFQLSKLTNIEISSSEDGIKATIGLNFPVNPRSIENIEPKCFQPFGIRVLFQK